MALSDLQRLFGYGPGVDPVRNTVVVVARMGWLFGGPLLGLAAISRYPWLVGEQFWWGCAIAVILGALLFIALLRKTWLAGWPLWMKACASVGFSLCAVFLLFGIAAFVNGLSSTTETREAICVGKHHSRGGAITYYLDVKPWAGSDQVAIIDAPKEVYNAVQPPAMVRLELARGSLGIAWLQGVSLAGAPVPR